VPPAVVTAPQVIYPTQKGGILIADSSGAGIRASSLAKYLHGIEEDEGLVEQHFQAKSESIEKIQDETADSPAKMSWYCKYVELAPFIHSYLSFSTEN